MMAQTRLGLTLTSFSPSSRQWFWWGALLGLPVVNVAAIALASFAMPSTPLMVVVAALALVELALLVKQCRRARIGAFELLAAMLGNVAVTVVIFIVIFWVSFEITCDDPCDGLS